ncbi:MAG: hypothetical protein ACRCWJ_03370, partial [Casimicrobium sp.]
MTENNATEIPVVTWVKTERCNVEQHVGWVERSDTHRLRSALHTRKKIALLSDTGNGGYRFAPPTLLTDAPRAI